MPLKPLRTMKEDAQDPSEQPPAQRLLPPNPHTMNQVIQTKNLPSPQVMDDEELQLYVQRLEKRHYRLSRKWWGMRRKYKETDVLIAECSPQMVRSARYIKDNMMSMSVRRLSHSIGG